MMNNRRLGTNRPDVSAIGLGCLIHAAVARIDLTADDLHAIDAAVSVIPIQGERYPAHLLALVGR